MNTPRSRSIKSFFIALAMTSLAFVFLSLAPTPAHASATDNLYGYAWSPNIGWIKMNNCDSPTGPCDSINYGVTMQMTGTTRYISGYAWSSNIGWVRFGYDDTDGCPPTATTTINTNCKSRVDWASGALKGWARACSVYASLECKGNLRDQSARGGWEGYISLGDSNTNDSANFGITMDTITGSMSGFGWGSHVVGWVDFSRVKFIPTTGDPVFCPNGAPAPNNDIAQCPDCLPGSPCWCTLPGNGTDPQCSCPVGSVCWCALPGNGTNPQCSCPVGSPCWCALPANGDNDLCNPCPVGSPCWCALPGNGTDPRCTTCQRGQPCWCANGANPGDAQCQFCALNPGDPRCPVGGTGQCDNIPDNIEATMVPPITFPPYRKVGGNCLCPAGQVLNSTYKCVKPDYREN